MIFKKGLKTFKYGFISSNIVIIKIHSTTQTKFNNKFKFFKILLSI